MASDVPAVAAVEPGPSAERLRRFGRGLARVARATARVVTGLAVVDSDVGWHVAQLPLLGLTMLAPRTIPVVATPDDGRRPVLFLHGLGGHRGNFIPMLGWLHLQGRRRLYAWGPPKEGSAEALAALLPGYIDEVLRVNGLPPDARVDLVGHSMGGLVARCALEDPAVAARVATLVTLGTPHAGSHAARYVATRDLRALRPDSPLITRLASARPPSTTRVVCFWSRSDVLLLPSTTAQLEGADNREVDGVTHYGYLLRREVWQGVHLALT